MRERFHKIATKVSDTVGSPIAFIAAVFIVVVWAFTVLYLTFPTLGNWL